MRLTQVGCQAHKVNLAVKASVGGKLPSSKHPDEMEDIEWDLVYLLKSTYHTVICNYGVLFPEKIVIQIK